MLVRSFFQKKYTIGDHSGRSRPAVHPVITAVTNLSAVVPYKVRGGVAREGDTLARAD